MMKANYYEQGYTLSDLGLENMSAQAMVDFMRTGER